MNEEHTTKKNYGVYRRLGNNMKRGTEEITEEGEVRMEKQRQNNENKGI